MKNIIRALALSAMSLLLVGIQPVMAAAPVPAAVPQEGTVYKIYRNGQLVGACVAQGSAELDGIAANLGAGNYVFVGTATGDASADRRIIVYTTTSLTGSAAAATADRRIIVYGSAQGSGASATADRRIIVY